MKSNAPRCPCGAYVVHHAVKIGHVCAPGDPWPQRWNRITEARMVAILECRAGGATLQRVAEQFGVTRERIRQIVNSSGIPICRKCKLPGELEPGRRLCHLCYQRQMNNRPSKRKRATGYRTDSRRHRRAWAVRLAREGRTRHEIAARLGVAYGTISKWLCDMRRAGREIDIACDPYFRNGREESQGGEE